MKKVAIIGGGVSGLACANLLKDRFEVVLYEKEQEVGGLIRCQRKNGGLFHLCGGHVFNTKNEEVKKWFSTQFNLEKEFIFADRYSAVCLESGRFVEYPIENHIYQLDEHQQKKIFEEIRTLKSESTCEPDNFKEFLLSRFGRTLYEVYFEPYNRKIWRQDLSSIPLGWLEGKLPAPTPDEILKANENRVEEKTFVHSRFYYPKNNGSQFIADRLARDVDIRRKKQVGSITIDDGKVIVRCADGFDKFDYAIYTGNLRELPGVLFGVDLGGFDAEISRFAFHGTTSVFCQSDVIPYSWFYQPSSKHQSHRIICTGNFSPDNNGVFPMTCTVEFTDDIDVDEAKRQLQLMPFRPSYITHHYSQYSYPIQSRTTRDIVVELKRLLHRYNISLVGRFAEWEYFNMDAAIASAMLCAKQLDT